MKEPWHRGRETSPHDANISLTINPFRTRFAKSARKTKFPDDSPNRLCAELYRAGMLKEKMQRESF